MALEHWKNPSVFTDDLVDKVKKLTITVFGLPDDTTLMGSAVPDAIILQPTLPSKFYVLMRDDDKKESKDWTAIELTTEAYIQFRNNTPFSELLYLLAESTPGLVSVERDWP